MRFLLIAAALLSSPNFAHSAEFRTFSGKDGRVLISIVGDIVEGDAERFKAAVKAANNTNKFVANIRLSSNGGNLIEGVKLAEAVKFAKIATNVGKNATCASACFLIFAAGETKYANYTARIGVHGASTPSGEEASDGTVAMARVAKELGVPAEIIGRMVVTPPTEMVWLSPQDLRSMGTTMVGKPEQVAAPNQIGQGRPGQTKPGDPIDLRASTQATRKPKSWSDLVDLAIARSASQNGGKARTIRTCEPKFKICWNAVIFKLSNGEEGVLKITRDIDEKVIKKEFCSLNKTSDIRKCINWDTGATVRSMKDINGDWYKVSDE